MSMADYTNIGLGILASMIAFLWNTLTSKIGEGDKRIEERLQGEIATLKERIAQHERTGDKVMSKLDALGEALRGIELRLAEGYVTKKELRFVNGQANPTQSLEAVLRQLLNKDEDKKCD